MAKMRWIAALLSLGAMLGVAGCGDTVQRADPSAAKATCWAAGITYATWWSDRQNDQRGYGLAPSLGKVSQQGHAVYEQCLRETR